MQGAAGAQAASRQRYQQQQQGQQQEHVAAAALPGKRTLHPDLQHHRRQQGMDGQLASRAWHQRKLLLQLGAALRQARLHLQQHCQATSRQQDLHHVLPTLRLRPTRYALYMGCWCRCLQHSSNQALGRLRQCTTVSK